MSAARRSLARRSRLAALLVACAAGAKADDALRGAPPAPTVLSVEQAAERLWPPGGEVRYRPSALDEKRVLRGLVERALDPHTEAPPLDPRAVAHAGWVVESWEVEGVTLTAVLERADDRRGAGVYLFRDAPAGPGSGRPILLEAPHAYFDLGTGELALRLFVEAPAAHAPRAFFTNTLHRSTVDGSDLARNPDHAFTAATAAFATAVERPELVQIHGFARERSSGDPRTPAHLLVSAGVASHTPEHVTEAAHRLRAVLGDVVARFPEEVSILGGTTNVQSRVLRQRRGARFLHLELSRSLRRDLLATAATRAAFGRALFGEDTP